MSQFIHKKFTLPNLVLREKVGYIGEDIVVKFLKKRGYEILAKNYAYTSDSAYRSGIKKGEIDIIAKKDRIIHFVEVKTLATDKEGFLPEDKVNWQKTRKIIKAAQIWLARQGLREVAWQIDVAAVILDLTTKKAKIRYFQDITKL